MNIVLCGFMGSGKSTVAKALSEKLKLKLVDLDEFIENKNHLSINQIFQKFGEEKFREFENNAVKELSSQDNLIISTGGGTVLNNSNVELLKNNGLIFFLNVSAETVISRLKDDKTRPLLNRTDKFDAIKNLLSNRLPIYEEAADYIIDSNDENVYAKVNKIIEKICKN